MPPALEEDAEEGQRPEPPGWVLHGARRPAAGLEARRCQRQPAPAVTKLHSDRSVALQELAATPDWLTGFHSDAQRNY